MSITKERKLELVKEYGNGASDTGSVEVQCAIFSERIRNLTGHMNGSKKDFQARRGLIHLVTQRRKLLQYLQRNDQNKYQDLIKRLGIRK
ncbi:MAG: 30S ribosomal protein S15 [Alphaproteobacteria bacterium]|jgi:small subunit ribosomal protein S15|nr:30S ribosomal protein S15 [Candidatus Jidaibacter sp.]